MNTCTSVVLRVTLACFVMGAEVCALAGSTTSSKQPSPLAQAADEFKTLTRDLGIRPESPPNAQEHRGPKMRWHGRIYENLRNDVLDAIPHEVKQNGESVSPLRRNQFGFNISGPVLFPHLLTNPNNTFFLLSYEGVRERISRANLLTIPTKEQRQGDFSQTVDSAGNILPIFDPQQTAPNPAYDPTQAVSTSNLQYLRSQFPGNVIPTLRLSPVAQQALTLYPSPNTNIGPFHQNNYFINSPQIDDADGIIAKVDHPFRERHRLTFNTTVSSGYLSPAKFFPNDASPTSPDQHFSTLHSDTGIRVDRQRQHRELGRAWRRTPTLCSRVPWWGNAFPLSPSIHSPTTYPWARLTRRHECARTTLARLPTRGRRGKASIPFI
jgi:hypothetical protein